MSTRNMRAWCGRFRADLVRGAFAPAILALAGAHSVCSYAQTTIKTDASWGRTAQMLAPSLSATGFNANSGARLNVPGNLYVIPQTLGRKAGANLFHSFERFGVGAGDAAVFTTAENFNNVISRVSGSAPSSIEGILSLQPVAGSRPNFFFINPNGVVFGGAAQIDMPGAFHVSTANQLRFVDDTVFKAGAGADSTLTIAAPSAFGFLGTTRASIAVRDGAVLEPAAGHAFSVVGGDVEISQSTLATHGGGDLRIAAVGSAVVDVPIVGPLPLLQGALSVIDGAALTATSLPGRNSGNIAISAGSITIDGRADGAGFAVINTIAVGGDAASAGDITLMAARELGIFAGGQVGSDSVSKNAGNVTVIADTITIDRQGAPGLTGIVTRAEPGSTGHAGDVNISAATLLSIQDGAQIGSGTFSVQDAGTVNVSAGNLNIDAQQGIQATGIFATSEKGAIGNAGNVNIFVPGDLRVANGGEISAATFAKGNAGTVNVHAQNLLIDGGFGEFFTGISSKANTPGEGAGGTVNVNVPGILAIIQGGEISSSTFTKHDAGAVTVSAGDIVLDRRGSELINGIFSGNEPVAAGRAGKVVVTVAGGLWMLNGAEISSNTRSLFPNADAGDVSVSVSGTISLINGSQIGSSTFGAANAGSVQVNAKSIAIDGDNAERSTGIFATASGSKGDAGLVQVTAERDIKIINGGAIASSTESQGKAGSVMVTAGSIGLVAGSIQAAANSGAGDAGDVNVTARSQLTVHDGGFIGASTSSARGRSGSVTVTAATLEVDGKSSLIEAGADEYSSGQTGTLAVTATQSLILSNGAKLSIRNDASIDHPESVSRTQLSVSAPSITLKDAQIDARSTGNVAASDIELHFGERLLIDPSHITTSANLGNGGAIRIDGNGVMVLDRSQVTTSVAGLSGNGGDISIRAGALVMNTGFIQANTEGAGASGGDVAINVPTFIPSGGTVLVGGSTPWVFQPQVFGFNVIQAAAPTGVSGMISLSVPALDIAASLRGLSTEVLQSSVLGRDFCRVGARSSLTPVGRGGLRPVSSLLIRPEPMHAHAQVAGTSAGSAQQLHLSALGDAYQCR